MAPSSAKRIENEIHEIRGIVYESMPICQLGNNGIDSPHPIFIINSRGKWIGSPEECRRADGDFS
jgi:hypothetical protein